VPNFFSYKLIHDYGFAPNPFHGFCTLATCKPHVRNSANMGDWIIGTGAITTRLQNRLIYIMQVSDKITFDEYWGGDRYQIKKPILNSSLVRMHGDNIYHKDLDGIWHQSNSQHSNSDGSVNAFNMKRDLSCNYVLIGDHFFYFGNKNISVSKKYQSLCSTVRDFIKIRNNQLAEEFVAHIKNTVQPGIIGDPINW